MHAVTLRHRFEAAHRLPHLGGQCANLHGHSWRVATTIATPFHLSPGGTVVEFGVFKQTWRTWIDRYLDHTALLGHSDPLIAPLRDQHCRVHVFGAGDGSGPQFTSAEELWPTVENVARLLARVARHCLILCAEHVMTAPGPFVARVEVTETDTNTATVELTR
jgi:6-pyruvoyltetrahydropterin/6-carboxytetrahydropterin synthase